MAQGTHVLTTHFERKLLADALVTPTGTTMQKRLGDLLVPGSGTGGLPVGSGPGTVAAGDDTRIVGAQNAAAVAAAVGAETAARTAADAALSSSIAANAVLIAARLVAASNLSDLASPASARGNLGLGGAAVLNVGAAMGTVAAGDDGRITGAQTAAQVASAIGAGTAANVSGVVALANGGTGGSSASAARTSLGLGTAAVLNAGATAGTLADGGTVASQGGTLATHTSQIAANTTAIAARLVAASNLSDLASPGTARGNLGLGGAAVLGVGAAAGTVAAGDDSRIAGALAVAAAAATYAPLANPNFTGIVKIGAGPFLADASQPVQMSAGANSLAFFAVNKNGAYGMLVGYDNTAGAAAAVIRNVAADPIDILVNNTTRAARFLPSGRVLVGTTTDDGANLIQVAGGAAVGDLNVAGTGAVAGAWAVTNPAVISAGGTLGTATGTVRSKKIGRTVLFSVDVSITANGTGTGTVNLPLPYAAAANEAFGGRDFFNGRTVSGVVAAASTTLAIALYDGTYPAVSGSRLVISGVYEANA